MSVTRSVQVKMPMGAYDANVQGKINFAEYDGLEAPVSMAERNQHKTARLFHLEGRNGGKYIFKIFGNGLYEMKKLDIDRVIARGTMMDPIVPQIIFK